MAVDVWLVFIAIKLMALASRVKVRSTGSLPAYEASTYSAYDLRILLTFGRATARQ